MYAKINNGVVEKFPYSIGLLRKDNPNTSFPKKPIDATLASYGVYPVKDTPAPSVSDTEVAYHTGNIVEVNGEWEREWTVRNKTQAELDADRAVMTEKVQAERARRLAVGFDYDFGDARGVHRIGTTAEDMKGWDEVTSWANAMLALGNNTATITIVTDTGPADVTPNEWQSVLAAASAFRQPIWAASFQLVEMDPIPSDYNDNKYWI